MPSLCIQSPIGPLTIISENDDIVTLEFSHTEAKDYHPVLLKCQEELKEYFDGKRSSFSLPLAPKGTLFQTNVWKALQEIPYGECVSYKEIASRVGNSKAMRAVGGANNKNPIPILIPCHRVIGANGRLVGYGGGIDKKIFLLELEGYNCSSSPI
ncbi:MAG: methylated-DNA--[protein]-cysteine S-methyltransferase [Campylobacteraceae bacterium]|nr:methylated-DNA--[protein]-cysteine S-methyltransferase [Campylobacteraceae bacterium]